MPGSAHPPTRPDSSEGRNHGPNVPVMRAKPVTVVDQRGVEHHGMPCDQMCRATGWRCGITFADEMGLTAGGWFERRPSMAVP